jgi:hypothetical protein
LNASRTGAARVATLATLAISLLLFSCAERQPPIDQQIATYLDAWFAAAESGARDDALCHGLGLLKHKQFTCAEYLEHAARVDGATRHIESITPTDCFAKVCGEFFQVAITAHDRAGNETDESAVIKRDNGKLKLYWYRSDSLVNVLQAANPMADAQDTDPQQAAYDEIIARYPSLYAYPPCYQIRPSSSNLVGKLQARDQMDPAKVDTWAQACGESFCFALVGEKIASLCPDPDPDPDPDPT